MEGLNGRKAKSRTTGSPPLTYMELVNCVYELGLLLRGYLDIEQRKLVLSMPGIPISSGVPGFAAAAVKGRYRTHRFCHEMSDVTSDVSTGLWRSGIRELHHLRCWIDTRSRSLQGLLVSRTRISVAKSDKQAWGLFSFGELVYPSEVSFDPKMSLQPSFYTSREGSQSTGRRTRLL